MENEFTYQELGDEQLEQVVGGWGGFRQLAVAANVALGNGLAQQNANATNQVGFININNTVQINVAII
jgi:hypothetical protein